MKARPKAFFGYCRNDGHSLLIANDDDYTSYSPEKNVAPLNIKEF